MQKASEFSGASQNQPESKQKKWLPVLLLVILAGSWIYFFTNDARSRKETDRLQTQLLLSDSSKAALEGDYRQTLQRIDELTVMNTGMDSMVRIRNREIENMKQRINTLLSKEKASAEELTEAKRLISALNETINGYVDTIMTLRIQNTALTSEKETIASQKAMLQERYEITRNAQQRAEEKLDIASTLVANNIQLTALHEKASGKEKETGNARRTTLLRCSFDVYNRVNEGGNQDLYIIVTDPFGQVVTDETLGSGRFTTRREGERLYTQKQTVAFKAGETMQVQSDWKPGKRFSPGLYIIEVYHNGFRIGEVEKTLKEISAF